MAEHAAFLAPLATPNIYLSANRSLSTRSHRQEFGLNEHVLVNQGSRSDSVVGFDLAHFDLGKIQLRIVGVGFFRLAKTQKFLKVQIKFLFVCVQFIVSGVS